MGIADHLSCLPRNHLYSGQEATVRTIHGTMDWLQIGKGVQQGCVLSRCLFNLYAEHHVKHRAGWITSWNQDFWEKYQQLQICRWYHSNGRECRGTEEPLDEGEKGECKAGLKLKIQKNKDHGIKSYYFLANRRGKSEAVTGFIFLAPK